jgi:hypothetical protein
MVLLEGLGRIPWPKVNPHCDVTWIQRLMLVSVVSSLLPVIAFISSYTAVLRKKDRRALRRQCGSVGPSKNRPDRVTADDRTRF